MSNPGVHAATSSKPRTLNRDDLLAERARLRATPASPERKAALDKITRQMKAIGNRSDRNGV